MNNTSENKIARGDAAVEALLEKAAPRLAPPSDDEVIVREAVLSEWQAVTGKRKTRQHMTRFAIAATVLLGVALSFNAFRVNGVQPEQVATISKSHGSIYLLGEQSELQELRDLSSITAGQVIVTGDDAGIGLQWGSGGSLRVDRNTRIEFRSTASVYLRSGRIYFDSQPVALAASISGGSTPVVAAIPGSGLEIETDHGLVKHLGTQYMTFVDSRDLIVSVREGQVSVIGNHYDGTAREGQQLRIEGSARPNVANISGFGEEWSWIEATAPNASMDGRSTHDFLYRIGRETGLTVIFESAAAETTAREGTLMGTIDMAPRDELKLRMSGEDLDYHIDGGAINVSAINTGSRP